MSQAGILSDSTTAAADIEFLTGDAGGTLGPDAAHNFNLIGTSAQGITTSGTGNTITWTISDATETQKGVSELATDAETIAGADSVRTVVSTSLKAKLGAQTANGFPYGAADTAAIAWTAAATDGQLLIGDTGSNPLIGNITGGTGITVTNGAGNISIAATTALAGTGTTVGAVTADLITFALGATPGTYTFQGRVAGFESTGPGGIGSRLITIVRTTGAAGIEIAAEDELPSQDAALAAASIDMIVAGNNLIVRVTGVAGLTINWRADFAYTFVS